MAKKTDETPRIETLFLDACLAMAHEKNPKEHDVDALIESFVRFGFKAFPAIDEETKVMVAGHGRCKALKKMRDEGYAPPDGIVAVDGDWRVPIIRGLRFKSARERDAYIIADNQHTIRGGWNMDLMGEFLGTLGGEFQGLGFDAAELETFGFSMEAPPSLDVGTERFDDAPLPDDGDGPKQVNVAGHTRTLHRVRPPAQMTNDDWTVHLGDCLEGLRALADNSVDAVVTDPPAGIGFMGKEWDKDKGGRDRWIEWLGAIMRECHRVLKPGGHGLAWCLPRTQHWTMLAIESASFEIRDVIYHAFGTGFPKSLDVSKAIDKAAGHWRGRAGEVTIEEQPSKGTEYERTPKGEPITEKARFADGWGTALKPAVEPWIMFRKPLDGTVADNFLKWGTGAINIDACRIGEEILFNHPAYNKPDQVYGLGIGKDSDAEYTTATGRWPAHLVLTHSDGCRVVGTKEEERQIDVGEKIAEVDRNVGFAMGRRERGTERVATTVFECVDGCPVRNFEEQTEGCSRFFYIAKPARAETEAGLDGLPIVSGAQVAGRKEGSKGMNSPRAGTAKGNRRNIHPTKKPIELMRYFVRMVAPRGGLVLDPFTGSGTTGLAALVEGCRFVGFEQMPEYHAIACARLRSIIDDPRGVETADEDPT